MKMDGDDLLSSIACSSHLPNCFPWNEDTCLASETSTGYLEDVFLLSSLSSKKRRLLLHSSTQHTNPLNLKWWASSSKCNDDDRIAGDYQRMDRKRAMTTKVVVCPFDVVKPLAGTTLDDINERIMMPPTRPVRHPVGEYACRPLRAKGLSGKTVVAYTTIHTQGRGTITITRTGQDAHAGIQ